MLNNKIDKLFEDMKVRHSLYSSERDEEERLAVINVGDSVIVNAGRFKNAKAQVLAMGLKGNNYKVQFDDGTKAIVFSDQIQKV